MTGGHTSDLATRSCRRSRAAWLPGCLVFKWCRKQSLPFSPTPRDGREGQAGHLTAALKQNLRFSVLYLFFVSNNIFLYYRYENAGRDHPTLENVVIIAVETRKAHAAEACDAAHDRIWHKYHESHLKIKDDFFTKYKFLSKTNLLL